MDTLARLCQQRSWNDFTQVAIEVSRECQMEVVHLIEPIKVRQIPKSRQDVRYDKVEIVPKYLLGWLVDYSDARDPSGHGFPQGCT